MKSIKKAVIPAAGYGTRLLPITKVVPKELLPIGNKPAIQYVVEEAISAGIEEIILVCHPAKVGIIDYFKPDESLETFLSSRGKKEELADLKRLEKMADFKVVYQKEPLGLGHAVWCAREEVGDEPFLVILPDMLISNETPATCQLLDNCHGGTSEWGVLIERVAPSQVSSYGIIRGEKMREGVYRMMGAVEKPKPSQAPSDFAILGRYLLPPEIMEILEKHREGALGEIQLTDAIDFLAKKRAGRAVIVNGDIFDIGTLEGLTKANQYYDETAGELSQWAQSGRMKMIRRS